MCLHLHRGCPEADDPSRCSGHRCPYPCRSRPGQICPGRFPDGGTASGFLLAIALANAGGSWDNAKKYIETGQHGGKGSDAHKAAVVGDTVGDPMKDTSGPSLNIMIKLMAVISLVFAPVIIDWNGWI